MIFAQASLKKLKTEIFMFSFKNLVYLCFIVSNYNLCKNLFYVYLIEKIFN